MRTETAPHSTAPRGLPLASRPTLTRPDISTATHDPTLLVAALEEIEARQKAIEWLADADLLRFCLV
jgi:hypothetical protein